MVDAKKNKYNHKAEVHPSINGILGLIAFSTRIPIKRFVTIEEMASSIIVWPYIGLCIGVLGAIIAYFLTSIIGFSSLLTATLIYCFIIWFTGYNHVDGIMDMGDGLMVHGDSEKRLRIMRDSMVGTGGIVSFFIVAIITIASLSSLPTEYLISSIILMEFCSRIGMLTTITFGSSDSTGIGRQIRAGISPLVLAITVIIAMLVAYFILNITGVIAVFVSVISGLIISNISEKNFGCVTGDIFGASHEITRAVALIFILINLSLAITI